jgi:hypothetical protein
LWEVRPSNASHAGGNRDALAYDAVVAALLAYAGSFSAFVGIALWPAAGLHAGLAIWCIVCLWAWGQKKSLPVDSF